MMEITIHELSTGAEIEGSPDNWVCKKVTGDYLNSTLREIPPIVSSAIAKNQFKAIPGKVADDRAIIGREIGNNHQFWSVIAVINFGKNQQEQDIPLARYFLCEGRGHLGDLLIWYKKVASRPIFDAFAKKTAAKTYNTSQNKTRQSTIPRKYQAFVNEKRPIIIPYNETCTPIILDALSSQINRDNQLISWAYNVEELANYETFHVIYPASQTSEESFRKITLQEITENMLTAIKGLTRRPHPNAEHLQTIASYINNPISWTSLFDIQGAKEALDEGYYTTEMVRLLTLRAIILPYTLPEFSLWMFKQKSSNEHYQISAKFQEFILQNVTREKSHFSENLRQGISWATHQLVETPKLLDVVFWLLSEGLWAWAYNNSLIKEINKAFETRLNDHSFKDSFFNLEPWRQLKHEVNFPYIRELFQQDIQIKPNPKYLPLVTLFARLGGKSQAIADQFYIISNHPSGLQIKQQPNPPQASAINPQNEQPSPQVRTKIVGNILHNSLALLSCFLVLLTIFADLHIGTWMFIGFLFIRFGRNKSQKNKGLSLLMANAMKNIIIFLIFICIIILLNWQPIFGLLSFLLFIILFPSS